MNQMDKVNQELGKQTVVEQTSLQKALTLCAILSEKKAQDIVYINVADKSSLCDYFIIAGGRSSTQVKSMAENLEEKAEKLGFDARRKEGLREGRWAVLDYTDVIVHIFNDEERDFYHLERLWEDGGNLHRYQETT